MKFFKIVLSIIILLSFILIGSPIEYNCFELNLVIIVIGMIFGIYKIIIKKEKIIDKRIDLVILFFYLTPIIPIIFNTCSSLEETLVALIRNISLFNIFCVLKEIVAKDDKNKSFVVDLILIGGIILVFLGIDELLSRNFLKYLIKIGIPNIFNKENRMFSSLGYANSFAIIMAIDVFLSLKGLRKGKVIYSGLIYLFLFSLWSSYSRAVLIIFAILFMIYLICLKNKKVYSVYIFSVNLILVLLSSKLFEIFSANEQNVFVWLSVAISFIISIIIAKIVRKNYRRICSIKSKTYIKLLIVFVILVCIVYIVGKQLDRPLEIFGDGEKNTQVRYKLNQVEASKDYNFIFDINADVKTNDYSENYVITIAEENKYYDTIGTHEIRFGDFIGKKEIELKTQEDTVAIVIFFNSQMNANQNGLTINSLYINGEKHALDYVYLPVQLVEKIESISLNHKSVWERQVYFKDGFKLIKSNFLFGLGANGWLYNYKDVQSYIYEAKEVHSYILQVFIDNGIIGSTLLVIICIYAFIKIIRRKRNITEIDMAFILLTIHSMMDFNMSFYVIMIIWVVLLTLVIKDNKGCEETNQDKPKIDKIMQIIFVILNIIILSLGVVRYKIKEVNENLIDLMKAYAKERNYNQAVEVIKDINEQDRYQTQIYNIIERINYKSMNEENMQYIYEFINDEKIVVDTKQNMLRNRIIEKILDNLSNEEMKEKFADIIIRKNEQIISNIKDIDKNRFSKEGIERLLEEQAKIYEKAKENK